MDKDYVLESRPNEENALSVMEKRKKEWGEEEEISSMWKRNQNMNEGRVSAKISKGEKYACTKKKKKNLKMSGNEIANDRKKDKKIENCVQ